VSTIATSGRRVGAQQIEALTGPAANDPAQRIAREIEVEQRTFDKLKGNVAPFVAIYAAGPVSLRTTSCDGRPGPLRGQRRFDQ